MADHRFAPPQLVPCSRCAVQRDEPKRVSIVQQEVAKFGVADAYCVLQHGLKHRLQLAGRTADDLEDLGGRRLLLQRLAQLARARLHLVEQSHVLDRDNRLVGEGLEKSNLLIRKRLNFGTSKLNCSDRHSVA